MSLLRAEAIRARRRALGLSQRRLGELCGLNGTTVHRIETEPGAGKYLRLNHLENLATALKVSPRWMLTTPASGGTTTPTPTDTTTDTPGDARALGALLVGQGPTPTQALAVSLGWPLDRLHQTLAALERCLSAVGATLRQENGTVEIVAEPLRAPQAVTRISRVRLGARPLNRDELRTFNEVRQPHIAAKRLDWLLRQQAAHRLINAGLLRAGIRRGDSSVLGDDVYTSQRVLAEHPTENRALGHPQFAERDAIAPEARGVVPERRLTAPVPVHPVTIPPPTETDWPTIRRWAQANGYEVGRHGGIRADVIAAYYRARSQSSNAAARSHRRTRTDRRRRSAPSSTSA